MSRARDRWLRRASAVALVVAASSGLLFYLCVSGELRNVAPQSEGASLSAIWALLATILAAGIWFILIWILIQVWEYRMLRTSLYCVEQLGDDRTPERATQDISRKRYDN